MMRHTAGNKAEHFSTVEFFSHMTCNFSREWLETFGIQRNTRELYEIWRDTIKRANEYIRCITYFCFKRTYRRDLTFRASIASTRTGVIFASRMNTVDGLRDFTEQERSSFLRFFIKNSSRAILYCVVWNYYIYYNDRNVVYYIIVLCHHYCNLI